MDKVPVHSWTDLVDAMPDREFRNVTRSSLPLLAYRMGLAVDEAADYHFEFTVPSLGGALPSHTDLMIICKDEVVAIEGKSTEPSYDSVSKWMAKAPATRPPVLEHWLNLITGATGAEIDRVAIHSCVYQMVHRLASACFVPRPTKKLVYQLFDTGGRHPSYETEMRTLRQAIGDSQHVEFSFESIPTRLTLLGKQLRARLLDVDEKRRPDLVRDGLLSQAVYEFGSETIEVIPHDR